MSRIQSSSVQLGKSYIFGGAEAGEDNLDKEKEIAESEEVLSAKVQAKEIINAAQEQAQRIIEEAQQQGQIIYSESAQKGADQGIKDGFEQGYNEGYNKIVQDLSANADEFKKITESAFELKKQIIRESEKEMIDLILLVAEKLTRAKLDVEPKIISKLIRAVIAETKEKDEIKILVNPTLTSAVAEISQSLKEEITGIETIKIIEDKTVSPAGVIIESMDKRIDARIETQIAQIAKDMLAEYADIKEAEIVDQPETGL